MEPNPDLIAEQIKHIQTFYNGRLSSLEDRITSQRDFYEHRIKILEEQIRDHETRIRTATEGVTQFKLFSGLASGGSSLISLAALVKTFFGG